MLCFESLRATGGGVILRSKVNTPRVDRLVSKVRSGNVVSCQQKASPVQAENILQFRGQTNENRVRS